MILGYLQVTFWSIAAERQIKTIRIRLLQSILRQEIGWFDTYKSGELNNRLTEYKKYPFDDKDFLKKVF